MRYCFRFSIVYVCFSNAIMHFFLQTPILYNSLIGDNALWRRRRRSCRETGISGPSSRNGFARGFMEWTLSQRYLFRAFQTLFSARSVCVPFSDAPKKFPCVWDTRPPSLALLSAHAKWCHLAGAEKALPLSFLLHVPFRMAKWRLCRTPPPRIHFSCVLGECTLLC